jgi:DNA-binding MarR family transcriptional regulator
MASLSTSLAKYHLDTLEEMDLVTTSLSAVNGKSYSLGKEGRKELFRLGELS